jgi:hypothetical protein
MSAGHAMDTAPYERLAKLIEHELELAGQGRLLELHDAVAARGAYLRALPMPAPPAARAAIERANALHSRVIIETLRARESLANSRRSLRRARRVAKTYAPLPTKRYSTSA